MNTNTNSTHNFSSISGGEEKAKTFLEFLKERKALYPVLLGMENSIADSMVIVTANSRRHAQGLADSLTDFCKQNKYELTGIEGYDIGDWILVDCNDILIHIFQEDSRNTYKLEELWGQHSRHINRENLS